MLAISQRPLWKQLWGGKKNPRIWRTRSHTKSTQLCFHLLGRTLHCLTFISDWRLSLILTTTSLITNPNLTLVQFLTKIFSKEVVIFFCALISVSAWFIFAGLPLSLVHHHLSTRCPQTLFPLSTTWLSSPHCSPVLLFPNQPVPSPAPTSTVSYSLMSAQYICLLSFPNQIISPVSTEQNTPLTASKKILDIHVTGSFAVTFPYSLKYVHHEAQREGTEKSCSWSLTAELIGHLYFLSQAFNTVQPVQVFSLRWWS